MNIDSMIEIITEEVLKKVTMLGLQRSEEKQIGILIIDSKSGQGKEEYDDILSKWQSTKFIDDYCHERGTDPFDYIIVPKLSNRDLVDIAVGNFKSKASEIIVDGIFKGKKVIVLEEGICYRKFENTANKSFFNMFKGYEEKIVGFGVKLVKRKDLTACLEGEPCKEKIKGGAVEDIDKALKEEKDIENTLIRKRIIAEKDIKELWNRGCSIIRIDGKAIITPLAKDFIRTNGINIKP